MKQRAFTLVEMLVGLAIIAILATILIVTLGPAKESAETTRNRHQLHQVGLAIQNYMVDYDQYFPPSLSAVFPESPGDRDRRLKEEPSVPYWGPDVIYSPRNGRMYQYVLNPAQMEEDHKALRTAFEESADAIVMDPSETNWRGSTTAGTAYHDKRSGKTFTPRTLDLGENDHYKVLGANLQGSVRYVDLFRPTEQR